MREITNKKSHPNHVQFPKIKHTMANRIRLQKGIGKSERVFIFSYIFHFLYRQRPKYSNAKITVLRFLLSRRREKREKNEPIEIQDKTKPKQNSDVVVLANRQSPI